MKLFNSLSRRIEDFRPGNPGRVGMYTCGPTVYDYVTIGNWRTSTLGDLLLRTLSYLGYEVTAIMNITDVGHLTGDNLGNADLGEDRIERAAKREKKSAWEVAKFYTEDFLEGFRALNLVSPEKFVKATEHIPEQIALIRTIEKRGFAYRISDGVYFDTKAFDQAGNRYGALSALDRIKEGARVEANRQKKDPRDFALWRFSPSKKKREMEWDSPWGRGFPGWHIECSAMSMKYLGDQFDIHVGGEDLRMTHHPNEIAQAEAGTGKRPFVRFWVHGAFLTVDGGRMGKSEGNAYTLHDLSKKGFDPLSLRYFYLTGHYRKPLNFTWEALEGADKAFKRLVESVAAFKAAGERTMISAEKLAKVDAYRLAFRKTLENDLGVPQALSLVWEVVKSNIPGYDKYDLLMDFDQVLGLDLAFSPSTSLRASLAYGEVPPDVQALIEKREALRKKKQFAKADKLRKEIEERGFVVEDTASGPRLKKKTN